MVSKIVLVAPNCELKKTKGLEERLGLGKKKKIEVNIIFLNMNMRTWESGESSQSHPMDSKTSTLTDPSLGRRVSGNRR